MANEEEKKQQTASEQIVAAVQARVTEFVIDQLDPELIKSFVAETGQEAVKELFNSYEFGKTIKVAVQNAIDQQMPTAITKVMSSEETHDKIRTAIANAVDEGIALAAKKIKDGTANTMTGGRF